MVKLLITGMVKLLITGMVKQCFTTGNYCARSHGEVRKDKEKLDLAKARLLVAAQFGWSLQVLDLNSFQNALFTTKFALHLRVSERL